jgi:hypothetical protein
MYSHVARRVVTRFSGATLILSGALSRAHATLCMSKNMNMNMNMNMPRTICHVKHCYYTARSLMEWHALAGISGYRRVRSINHVQTRYQFISVNTLSPSPRRLASPLTSESTAPHTSASVYRRLMSIPHSYHIHTLLLPGPQRTRRLSYTIVAPPESHSACANLLPSLSDRYPGVACSEARSEPVSNCPSTCPRDPCPPPQPSPTYFSQTRSAPCKLYLPKFPLVPDRSGSPSPRWIVRWAFAAFGHDTENKAVSLPLFDQGCDVSL